MNDNNTVGSVSTVDLMRAMHPDVGNEDEHDWSLVDGLNPSRPRTETAAMLRRVADFLDPAK